MEQDRTPRASVVMPVRNGARWIAEAVDSIRRQDIDEWELIVVDDGSTDQTPEILQPLAARDARIKLLTGPSRGIVAALNLGVSQARAELIARLDSDDIAHPTRLRRQVETFTADPALVLLGTWARVIDDRGRVTGRRTPQTSTSEFGAILRDRNPFIHSSVMMRRSTLARVGAYRPPVENAEDYDLWLRLSEIGKVAILGEDLIDYRVHATSATSSRPLLQSFAARLSRVSAAARSAGEPDPLDAIESALSWNCSELDQSAFVPAVQLYKLLEFDASRANVNESALRLELPDFQLLRPLAHTEKVMLRRAVLRCAAAPGRRGGLGATSLVRAFLATLA